MTLRNDSIFRNGDTYVCKKRQKDDNFKVAHCPLTGTLMPMIAILRKRKGNEADGTLPVGPRTDVEIEAVTLQAEGTVLFTTKCLRGWQERLR